MEHFLEIVDILNKKGYPVEAVTTDHGIEVNFNNKTYGYVGFASLESMLIVLADAIRTFNK